MSTIPQRCVALAAMAVAMCGAAVHAAEAPKTPKTRDVTTAAPGVARVVATARAGAVQGTTQNSDEFIWRLFTRFAAPTPGAQPPSVIFDTWASDADTFTATPAWPGPGTPRKFQASALLTAKRHGGGPVDLPCATPGCHRCGKTIA